MLETHSRAASISLTYSLYFFMACFNLSLGAGGFASALKKIFRSFSEESQFGKMLHGIKNGHFLRLAIGNKACAAGLEFLAKQDLGAAAVPMASN